MVLNDYIRLDMFFFFFIVSSFDGFLLFGAAATGFLFFTSTVLMVFTVLNSFGFL